MWWCAAIRKSQSRHINNPDVQRTSGFVCVSAQISAVHKNLYAACAARASKVYRTVSIWNVGAGIARPPRYNAANSPKAHAKTHDFSAWATNGRPYNIHGTWCDKYQFDYPYKKSGAVQHLTFHVYLPAMDRPSTRTLGLPKAVMPMAEGSWQLLASAVMFFSRS